MVTIRFLAFLALALGTSGAPSAPAVREAASDDANGQGKALVQDLLSRIPREDAEILGLLKMRAPNRPLIEIPIKTTIRVAQDAWHDIYETQPIGDRLGEILIVKHRGRERNEYSHARFESREQPPKFTTVQGTNLFQPFAGSDFFLADLGLEFLHWPSQKVVKKEMRKSRACRVVESLNPNPGIGGYSRVLSWLDVESGNIIRAEGYDLNNRKLKEFSIRKIDRSEGKVQVKEMEIINDQTDSRTRLEFNLEVTEP
jgi:hypothetical protein